MIRVTYGLVAVTLLILTLIFFAPPEAAGNLGLCLPSPNQWQMPHFWEWLINSLLIFFSAALLTAANKRLNFISEADPLMGIAMLVLLCCNCLTTASLTTSTLLLAANSLALFILLSTYEQRNASREFFLIATLPAIGAMVQYSFLIMVPVYIAGGLMMKSFRLRELIAFLFGLAAPYWIAIGLGWVSPCSFSLPGKLTVFNSEAVNADIMLTLLAAGAMILAGVILALYNGLRLFSRNSQLRCMHSAFNFLGLACVVAVIVDFDNFAAYFGSLALWVAIEFATMLTIYNVRHPRFWLLGLLALFLPLYILAL